MPAATQVSQGQRGRYRGTAGENDKVATSGNQCNERTTPSTFFYTNRMNILFTDPVRAVALPPSDSTSPAIVLKCHRFGKAADPRSST